MIQPLFQDNDSDRYRSFVVLLRRLLISINHMFYRHLFAINVMYRPRNRKRKLLRQVRSLHNEQDQNDHDLLLRNEIINSGEKIIHLGDLKPNI